MPPKPDQQPGNQNTPSNKYSKLEPLRWFILTAKTGAQASKLEKRTFIFERIYPQGGIAKEGEDSRKRIPLDREVVEP